MPKKYKYIVLGYARKSRIANRKSKYYCPACYDNKTENISRLRDGWFWCRACGHEYASDDRIEEEFD